MGPRASRETASPLRPSGRCCMHEPYSDCARREMLRAGRLPDAARWIGCPLSDHRLWEDHVRLGISLGYQSAWSTPADHLAMAQEADRLGFAGAWAAEAYGSDTVSMLAWIAGQTQQIDLGAAVMQIPARTPAMTAMTAATIDALSGGRVRLGPGVAGPEVPGGCHGVPFGRPLQPPRESVDIVKMAIAREPVSY